MSLTVSWLGTPTRSSYLIVPPCTLFSSRPALHPVKPLSSPALPYTENTPCSPSSSSLYPRTIPRYPEGSPVVDSQPPRILTIENRASRSPGDVYRRQSIQLLLRRRERTIGSPFPVIPYIYISLSLSRSSKNLQDENRPLGNFNVTF